MENSANSNIKCSVEQCKYNKGTEPYCTLDVVQIGTHESNPTQKECVDCESFAKRSCC